MDIFAYNIDRVGNCNGIGRYGESVWIPMEKTGDIYRYRRGVIVSAPREFRPAGREDIARELADRGDVIL